MNDPDFVSIIERASANAPRATDVFDLVKHIGEIKKALMAVKMVAAQNPESLPDEVRAALEIPIVKAVSMPL